MRKSFLIIGFILAASTSQAQLGGTRAFAFVHLDPAGRAASLGGSHITAFDGDVVAGYQNPSMLNPQHHNNVALSYTNYLADLNYGFTSYAYSFDSAGTISGSIFFMDYGTFDETDITGRKIGEFWAQDYIFQLSYGNLYPDDYRFRYGVSVKFLYSVYEKYVATAGAVDGALSYVDEDKKMVATLLLKNVGYNFIPYNDVREKLPTEVQFGFSKKLEHNPLRFSIVGHNLQQADISYVNPNLRNKIIDIETGKVQAQKISFGDKVMRHVIVGGELVFSDNFQLRIGYNHMRRQELSPENSKGMTGFSWGVGVGIKKFFFDYAMVSYFPGITTSYFSIRKNLSDFKRMPGGGTLQ